MTKPAPDPSDSSSSSDNIPSDLGWGPPDPSLGSYLPSDGDAPPAIKPSAKRGKKKIYSSDSPTELAAHDFPESSKKRTSNRPDTSRGHRAPQSNASGRGSFAHHKSRAEDESTLARKPRHIDGNFFDRGEPLSLAEELVARGITKKQLIDNYEQYRDEDSNATEVLGQLEKLRTAELIEEARNQDLTKLEGLERRELIFELLKSRIKLSGLLHGEGTLEILQEGFGFLRCAEKHYLPSPDDIYVSPSQIRRFSLKSGSIISGRIRPPKENERYFAMLCLETINGENATTRKPRPDFDELSTVVPNEQIRLENSPKELSGRVIDLLAPIAFGQRGLVVAPPRSGKTVLIQKMARDILGNYPETHVFVLLIDERPEEVAEVQRALGEFEKCEIVSSTFDEATSRHIQVASMVMEKSRRFVEHKKDVVIFLDSVTRYARAWNAESIESGKSAPGRISAKALEKPKQFFSSARKIENGGSLTVIATALTDTGSRMDDVVFDEFKDMGDQEIHLDRTLADNRIWPAINISESGVNSDDLLYHEDEYQCVTRLRKLLEGMDSTCAMEKLIEMLADAKSNDELLAQYS